MNAMSDILNLIKIINYSFSRDHLFSKLLFAQFVQGVEFPGERNIFQETAAG